MAASRINSRRTAHCHAAAAPDNRLIIASAILSLAVLLLMLIAGTAEVADVAPLPAALERLP